MTWLVFWIGALACYRVTVLITRCVGPYGLFKKLRSIDRCSKLLKCPFCVSVYVGAITAVGLWLAGYFEPWPMWIMIALAFSSVTIALDRTFTADVTN
jgi:hypothetical protein